MPRKSTRKYDTMNVFRSNSQKNEYDFSNDGAIEAYRNIGEPYKKFFSYTGHPDPDSESELLQEIYKKLWDDKTLELCRNDKKVVCGETLISQNTTLNKLYMVRETPDEKRKRINSGRKIVSAKYLKELYPTANNELESKLRLGAEKDYVGDMLGIYHTLGNFMPFPCGCNRARGIGSTKDYWDLMLNIICKYYKGEKDEIDKIVGKAKSDNFRDWLNQYGQKESGWIKFIEKNYLQSFVDENNNPKELWEGHFDAYEEKGAFPTGKRKEKLEQIKQFYDNGYNFITERTKTMMKELNKKMSQEK
jgi:hypothetical protein